MANNLVFMLCIKFRYRVSSSSSSLTPGISLRGSTPVKNFTRTPVNPPGSRKTPRHSSSVTPGVSGPSVLVGMVAKGLKQVLDPSLSDKVSPL